MPTGNRETSPNPKWALEQLSGLTADGGASAKGMPLSPLDAKSAFGPAAAAAFAAAFSPASPTAPAEMALFAPLHYEPHYAYPLLVWLHGDGGDERQLIRIMPLVSMRNYVAVAVRGLSKDGAPSAACWPQDSDSHAEADSRVEQAIEHSARKFHVARERVFLAGFDTGGTMALKIALTRPAEFAGAISLGGCMPKGAAPLANLAAARRVPVFLAAGRQSTTYESAEVCADLRLLHTAGMSVTLREYPCGHELSPQMLADVDRWMIEQVTSGRRGV